MWGWTFIVLGIVIGSIGIFLVYFGQDLLSKANTTSPGINVTGSGNAVNVGGTLIQPLPLSPDRPAPASPASAHVGVLENAGFERGLESWGTGFFEAAFAVEGPLQRAITANGAVATWRVEGRKAREGGVLALRVEHSSDRGRNVYSMLSQRIKIKPQTAYRVGFWFFVDAADPRGPFNLRFLPSRHASEEEWDRRRIKVENPKSGEWTRYSATFNTEGDAYFDVRFFAEGRVSGWVDDVFVEEAVPQR